MKRLALTTTLFLLAGCGAPQPGEPTAIKNPDTYTYVTISDMDSLDPAWSYDTASHLVILNVYEPLLGYKGSSTEELVPVIASQVPSSANGLISPDGLTYTFPIRPGVEFQDGTPLTPEDVKYSLMRFLLQDRAGGPSSLLLEPILGYSSTRDENGRVLEKAFQEADRRLQVQGNDLVITNPKALRSTSEHTGNLGAFHLQTVGDQSRRLGRDRILLEGIQQPPKGILLFL